MKKLGLIAAIISLLVYIANPGMGVIELIPDNIPFIGNLDEAGATALLIKCLMMLRKKPKKTERSHTEIDV